MLEWRYNLCTRSSFVLALSQSVNATNKQVGRISAAMYTVIGEICQYIVANIQLSAS